MTLLDRVIQIQIADDRDGQEFQVNHLDWGRKKMIGICKNDEKNYYQRPCSFQRFPTTDFHK